jgi:P-type Cu+ transporter
MSSETKVDRAKDPVCGMEVDPAQAAGEHAEHNGVAYSFCSPACRESSSPIRGTT